MWYKNREKSEAICLNDMTLIEVEETKETVNVKGHIRCNSGLVEITIESYFSTSDYAKEFIDWLIHRMSTPDGKKIFSWELFKEERY